MRQSSKLFIIFTPIIIIITLTIGSIFAKEINNLIGLPQAANYITIFTIIGEIGLAFLFVGLIAMKKSKKKEKYRLSNIALS